MMTPSEVWTQHPKRLIVTGGVGAGKTTWVRHFIAHAKAQHAQVCGLLSPAIVENGVKTGIALVNLATGEQRPLARLRTETPDDGSGVVTQRWRFDSDGLAWGDAVLRDITQTDLLVIDEIGPLELERGAGWQSALGLIDSDRHYEMACVVVRSPLISMALARWPQAVTLECGLQ